MLNQLVIMIVSICDLLFDDSGSTFLIKLNVSRRLRVFQIVPTANKLTRIDFSVAGEWVVDGLLFQGE